MLYNVYHEPADTDDEKKFIGTIEAPYAGEAYKLASQFYEVPEHDLIVKRADQDTQATK